MTNSITLGSFYTIICFEIGTEKLPAYNHLQNHTKLFKLPFPPLIMFLKDISNGYLPQHFNQRTKKISILFKEIVLSEEPLWGRKVKKENPCGLMHNTGISARLMIQRSVAGRIIILMDTTPILDDKTSSLN